MGDVLGKLFIEPSTLTGEYGFVQVLFLGFVYGYILFNASNMISDGSELLLLVPSLAGLVGSVVLPILGAVPDGAIVLFSGLGPNAQEELKVGVGALAGSTIMLFTIPWFLSIMGGRVNYEDGKCTYTKPRVAGEEWSKLMPESNFSLTGTAVECESSIAVNAKLVMLTALSYFIIQLPAFYCRGEPIKIAAAFENGFALAGMIVTFVAFCLYLVYQAREASKSKVVKDLIMEKKRSALDGGLMNIRGVMYEAFLLDEMSRSQAAAAMQAGGAAVGGHGRASRTARVSLLGGDSLMTAQQKARRDMENLLRPFFNRLDSDGSGKLDRYEIRKLFFVLHERPTEETMKKFFERCDRDGSGYVDFQEFIDAMIEYVREEQKQTRRGSSVWRAPRPVASDDDEEEEEEEEEEVPEDLEHLSPEEQQKRIKIRAATLMAVGTGLVLLFSDPMVAVFSEIGTRLNISSFYISFVLAPLASNASEVIASYNYSLKKTRKTISISFAALEGAACMNNTFCLFVFLCLVWAQNLTWQFSAETIVIIIVEYVMAFVAMRRTHRLLDGLLVLCLYPISLGIVWALENVAGWD